MRNKKNLAAKILNVSPKKVVFATDALDDIQKAITRSDMRGLIAVGKISKARLSSKRGLSSTFLKNPSALLEGKVNKKLSVGN